MPTNPFIILGISRDASQNEIYEAYKAKRDYYKEHIFDEGESGAQAARMLEQVEQAYKQAMDMSHDNATVSGEIVFYEKNWLNDSRKQLEIALQMDPGNPKYQRAIDNLKKKIDGSRPYDKEGSGNVYQNNNDTATDRSYSQNAAATSDGCCAACQALWCADCCCECMGGDLIRCC